MEPAVRDSAGVLIVENPAPDGSLPVWSLAETPDLVIGETDVDRAEDGAGVPLHRVADARFLSDGGVVVFNAGTWQLLWFSARGGLTRRSGGLGDGPSEFRGFDGMDILSGDTIVVLNPRPPSEKTFGPDGEFIGSRSIDAPVPLRATRIHGNHWAGLEFAFDEPPPRQVELFREHWYAVRFSPDMTVWDTIDRVPGGLFFGSGERSVRVQPTPRALLASRDGQIVVGSSDRYELRIFEATGDLQAILRNHVPNPEFLAPEAEPAPEEVRRDQRAAPVLDPPEPEAAPAFEALQIASDGSIWVKRHDPGEGGPTQEWHVYDDRKHLVATAVFPAAFRPTEITATHMVGVWTGELDVETVRVFRILR